MSETGDEVDLQLFKTYGQLPSASFVELGGATQFDDWIRGCKTRQLELFNVDVSVLEGDELLEYVNTNTLALLDEIHELLHAVAWKPWATSNRGTVDVARVLDELPDVMFFLGNLLATFDVTGDEIELALHAKDEIVRMRADGYDPTTQMNYRQLFLARHGVGPWICHFCSNATDFDDLAIHHLDEDRTNSADENLVPTHKRCHSRHHAKQRTARDRDVRVTCEECGLVLGPAGLSAHMRHKHGKGRPQPTAYKENPIPTECDECGQTFKGVRGINAHKRHMHSDHVQVMCVACNVVFKDRAAAASHQARTHDAESITCPVCDRVCKGRSAYGHHVAESHGGDKVLLACELCDKQFVGVRGLKIHHARTHVTVCSDCGRDLATVTLIDIVEADGSSRQACPCGKVL